MTDEEILTVIKIYNETLVQGYKCTSAEDMVRIVRLCLEENNGDNK